MSAAAVTTTQFAQPGGLAAGGGTQAGVPTGAPAFLAILDQMLGLAAAGHATAGTSEDAGKAAGSLPFAAPTRPGTSPLPALRGLPGLPGLDANAAPAPAPGAGEAGEDAVGEAPAVPDPIAGPAASAATSAPPVDRFNAADPAATTDDGADTSVVQRRALVEAAGSQPGTGGREAVDPAPATRPDSVPAARDAAATAALLVAQAHASPDSADGLLATLARMQPSAATQGEGNAVPAIPTGAAGDQSGLAAPPAPVPETGRGRTSDRAQADHRGDGEGSDRRGEPAARGSELDRLLATTRDAARAAARIAANASGSTESDLQVEVPDQRPGAWLTSAAAAGETGEGWQALARTAAQAAGAASRLFPAARPDVGALALQIAHQAREGGQSFEIALDPPELGRVDVRLEFARDGKLTTHLLVDRSDTLDALMRDARGLERALQAQGLKLDDGSIQYHLRDQSSFAQQQQQDGRSPHRSGTPAADAPGELQSTDTDPPAPTRRLVLGGLDLTV